jgi:hypothetical protein
VMSDEDCFAIVDRPRSAGLDDVGGPGLTVVVAVDVNGDEHWGVVDRRDIGNRTKGFGLGSTPPHEELGRLPLGTLRRIAIAQRKEQPE